MEKKKENKYVKGTLILLLGGIICKFIGAFYRIPLSNILGAEGIGVYQLIFPIYSLFLIFVSGGVPIALSKIIAECRARGEYKRGKRFLLQSIFYLFITSLFLSIFFFIFAKQIALIQGNLSASLGYLSVAIAIVFASVLTAFRGYFQGYQNMIPTAISQIIEQIFKLVLGLIFASNFIKWGIQYGVFGAMLGIAIGEIIALVYLSISYIYKKKKNKDILKPEQYITTRFKEDFKLLIKRSWPITLNSIILPLILAIDSFLIINLLLKTGLDSSTSTQMFGIYSGMVNSLINLPTIVSMTLAISIVPAISYSLEKGENSVSLVSSTFKVVLFISLPSTLIFMFFPNEIMTILYPNAISAGYLILGTNLLRISAINIIYISFLQISTAILQASNKGGISLINLFFSGILKIIFTVFFVLSPLNIYGAAIGAVLCFALASGLNLIALKNEFGFNLKTKEVGYIFLSSATMLGAAIGFIYLFNIFLSWTVSAILALFLSGIIYLSFSLFLPIFTNEELNKIPFGSKICIVKNKLNTRFKINKI